MSGEDFFFDDGVDVDEEEVVDSECEDSECEDSECEDSESDDSDDSGDSDDEDEEEEEEADDEEDYYEVARTASRRGDVATLRLWLAEHAGEKLASSSPIFSRGEITGFFVSLINEAVLHDRVECVEALLDHGVRVDDEIEDCEMDPPKYHPMIFLRSGTTASSWSLCFCRVVQFGNRNCGV
jgi:hypothetical protein